MADKQALERRMLRNRSLEQRNALSPAHRKNMSRRIIDTLIALPVFQENSLYFIYCSYQSEVETSLLIDRCLKAGKTVCVPMTTPAQSRMQAVVIKDAGIDLRPGYKGIPEPILHLVQDGELKPEAIEVAVIPGAVFDRCGHRLGYGGGYYDRFLARAPQALRIGLAYSMQLVNHIPALPHDMPMDILITEHEILTWPRLPDAKNSCL